METLTGTLVERVQAFVGPDRSPIEWGSPLLSTTPTPVAIHQLAVQLAALQEAVREIAADVHKLTVPAGDHA
jgi:hypothetical protein